MSHIANNSLEVILNEFLLIIFVIIIYGTSQVQLKSYLSKNVYKIKIKVNKITSNSTIMNYF